MSRSADDQMSPVWIIEANDASPADDAFFYAEKDEKPEPRPSVARGFLVAGLASLVLWSVLMYLVYLLFR